ncbi:hypothetical protein LQW54_007932 [Pestalotiopsis sp. IQ-011]
MASHTPTASASDPRATLRSLSQLNAAAAGIICSCLVADLPTTIGFTATATQTATIILGIDAVDGTPEDVRYDGYLQQTMTKIDTRPVYTVSVRLMPWGIYPDPAQPAQPGYCYFTTTWGSLRIDRQVYTQANGSSSDFYDIVVPGVVQPNDTAILKLDFSCDPGFIGMGYANIIIDRVYIVPTLLCT